MSCVFKRQVAKIHRKNAVVEGTERSSRVGQQGETQIQRSLPRAPHPPLGKPWEVWEKDSPDQRVIYKGKGIHV